jgi:RNA polymerase sigma-70 factor (ECF subfamily)
MPAALIDSTTPSRLVVYREQAAAMQAAMNELPEDVRDVIRLRLVEQLTLETIAQVLGLGVAAVRHRFRKGAELYRTRLRSSLSGFSHHRSVHPRDSAPPGRPSSAQD